MSTQKTRQQFRQELEMKTQSRFFKGAALMSALLTGGLLLSSAQPASAGASTGSWKYYPNGLYGAPAYGHRGYAGNPGYYGYPGRPVYGSPYAQPYYGNGGYYGNGYYEPYYRRHNDNGAAVAAGVM